MLLPRNYLRASEAALASYSFTDLAEGTGVVVNYGANAVSNTATTYFLTTTTMYSGTVTTRETVTTIGYLKEVDVDFDQTFNLPKRIKGTSRVNLTIGGKADSGVTTTLYGYVRIKKNDVEIASERTPLLNVVSNTYASKMYTLEIPITTMQHFKKGDILRVTVEIWAKRTGAGANLCGFAHDPENRNDTGDGVAANRIILDVDDTLFKVYIPYVIDL